MKKRLSHSCEVSSSGSLASFRPIIWFLFPHLTYPGTLPWLYMHLSARMDLKVKASGRSKAHYVLVLSLDFLTHKEPFCACVASPLSEKRGQGEPLILYSHRVLPPLRPCLDYCHDHYLNVFTKDKRWLFTLFLLLFPFCRAKRRLTLNALTRAPLSLVSGNVNSCDCSACSPLLRAPCNVNKRPVLNV